MYVYGSLAGSRWLTEPDTTRPVIIVGLAVASAASGMCMAIPSQSVVTSSAAAGYYMLVASRAVTGAGTGAVAAALASIGERCVGVTVCVWPDEVIFCAWVLLGAAGVWMSA